MAAKKKARRGRGEGSIEHIADKNLWKARLSLGYDANGKRIRRAVYGATKAECAEKLRALQVKHDAGRLVDADELTTGEFLTRWLVTASGKTRPGTFERYKQLTEQYLIPALGKIKLAKLRPIHVETAYASLSRESKAGKIEASANTRRAAGTVLGIALRHAVRLKLITANPAADIAKPRSGFREMKFMSSSQAKQFLETAKSVSRNYALYALALGSGMRQGELLGLTWADLDFAKGTVEVRRSLSFVKNTYTVKEPKSRTSKRTVGLPPFVVEALREHRAAALKAGHITGPVFASSVGTYLNRSNMLREFRALVVKANAATENAEADQIPEAIRFHDLRHSHASCLIAAGSSIKAVSRRLGHADITVTLKVYAHLMPDDDSKLTGQAEALFG